MPLSPFRTRLLLALIGLLLILSSIAALLSATPPRERERLHDALEPTWFVPPSEGAP